MSLPLPVSLKRFLAPLWVFIFGMGTDLLTYPPALPVVRVQQPIESLAGVQLGPEGCCLLC
jgi:hypothetical protein